MNHFYDKIEGWSHYLAPFYGYIVPYLPDNCKVVEIGCWKGRSLACLAVELINSKKQFELSAVDHWQGTEAEGWYYQSSEVKQLIESRRIVEIFKENIAPVLDRVNVIELASADAAKLFEDSSIDLVIIDDDHSYEGIKRSIRAWLPKVKPGGYLAGDDHDTNFSPLVQALVEIFSTDYKIIGPDTQTHYGAHQAGVWLWQKPLEGWVMPEILLLSETEFHRAPPPVPEFIVAKEPAPEPVPEPEPVAPVANAVPEKPSLQNPRVRVV